MTGLVRKAILLSAVGLVVAGVATAGVPSSANSTKPSYVLTTGHNNPPDPVGLGTYIIRDASNFVVANAEVVLDFTRCTDIKLSDNIFGSTVTTTCASHRVTGNTDGLGVLNFNVVAGSNGNGPTRESLNALNHLCVAVTVNSVPFPDISAAAVDRDGVSGVASGDYSAIIFDFVNNPAAGRSDIDNTGAVASGDLSKLIAVFVASGSSISGSPYCAP
jgi:hypothetical protein